MYVLKRDVKLQPTIRLKYAARGSLKIQDAKITQKIAIFATWHNFIRLCIRNSGMYRQSEKKLLNSNISSTCHNMVNFCLLTTEIGWRVCGTPANFNVFRVLLRYCTDIAQRTSTKLCTMFGRLLSWYTNGILPDAKFTLCSSLAFSCTRNGITELSLLVIFNRGHHL